MATDQSGATINRVRKRIEYEINTRSLRSDPRSAGPLTMAGDWQRQAVIDSHWVAALQWVLSVLLDEVLSEQD